MLDLNDLPPLLPVPRAAKLLGISRASAYRYASAGDLPSRRLGGRVFILTSGLLSLLKEHPSLPGNADLAKNGS